jgi:hypothetical protein
MTASIRKSIAGITLAFGALTLGACASMMPGGADKVTLVGANEVPAVTTSAMGTGSIVIASDGSVTGSITVTGMTPTAGHIHQGAPGMNGPVIVPFVQSGNTFSPAPGAKLTEAQMTAYRAGNLYVNVHSAAHMGGEIRAQLKAG